MATKSQKFEFAGAHWLDVSGPSKDFLHNLAKTYNLPRSMLKDCLDPEHLPKFEHSEKIKFLILRAYDIEASASAVTIQELSRKIAIFWNSEFILTIHRKDLPLLEALRAKWGAKSGENGPAAIHGILEDIAETVIESYEPVIDAADVELEAIEEKVMGEKHSVEASSILLEACYNSKRKCSSLKRIFRLTRDIYSPLMKGDASTPFFLNLKEEADRLFLYADDLVESVSDLLQIYILLTSNRTNESSHKTNEIIRFLTIFSVFFMPINFIAGLYGMNFQYMPELKEPWAYPAALGLMAFISITIYIWFRKRGWLK